MHPRFGDTDDEPSAGGRGLLRLNFSHKKREAGVGRCGIAELCEVRRTQPSTTRVIMTTILTKAVACESCTYWKQAKSTAADGECRRHAPQTIAFTVDSDVKFESRFPATKAADWCGDYSAKN